MYIKPATGQSVPDPDSGGILPAAGRDVRPSIYWGQRLLVGDVVSAADPASPLFDPLDPTKRYIVNAPRPYVSVDGGGNSLIRQTTTARVVLVGNSLTANGPVGNWANSIILSSNGRYKLVLNGALPATRTQYAIDNFPIHSVTASEEVWICTGTNESDVPVLTTSQFVAKLYELLNLWIATGRTVRLFSIPPKDAAIAVIQAYRDAIASVGMRLGVATHDIFAPLVNPATGGFNAADTLDGIHPSTAGYNKVTTRGIALLGINTTPNIALPTMNAANGGLIANPLFLTDSNADGIANGLASAGGGGVFSLVASNFGNKQRITATSLTSATGITASPVVAIPGHLYSIKSKFTAVGAGYFWYVRLTWFNAAVGSISTETPIFTVADLSGELELQLVAPPLAAYIGIILFTDKQAAVANYSVVIDWEQFQITDLTALGMS